MDYKQLCKKRLTDLTDAELKFCLKNELDCNDLVNLADTSSEFDRRYGTETRQCVADANNALMRLGEQIQMAAFS
jgi:hypothetical protein